MATSRTGTSQWKKLRQQTLRNAQQNGQTQCPRCRVQLNYTQGQQPNSAEVDHIEPWSKGGTNTLTNTRIICRKCNQQLGGKLGNQKQQTQRKNKTKNNTQPTTLTTNINW